MPQYTLAVDWPSYPAGTVLTQREDGRYVSDDGQMWFDADLVEGNVVDASQVQQRTGAQAMVNTYVPIPTDNPLQFVVVADGS